MALQLLRFGISETTLYKKQNEYAEFMDAIKKDWKDDYGKKITVHGFRSTMRDYVAEQTDFDAQTAETALAHQVGTSVERAYRRGDLLEKRRALMQFYGDYAWGVASLEKRHK